MSNINIKAIINNSYLKSYDVLGDDVIVLHIIYLLHFNGKINDQSLYAYIKQYKNRTINKYRNNFHFKPLDIWYNNAYSLKIFEYVLSRYNDINYVMDIENYIKYVMKTHNKNKNYAINKILVELFSKIVHFEYKFTKDTHFNFEVISEILTDFKSVTPKVDYEHGYYKSMYCCEDCDGPYDEYGLYSYIEDLKHSKKNLNKEIVEYFEKYRSKNWDKNPNKKDIYDIVNEIF